MKVIGINKTQMVRDMLVTHPKLTPQQIADAVDCHVTIVHEQKRRALKAKQMTAKKQGRPSKMQVVSDGVAGASKLLADLATMNELLITIYDGKVVINKSDIDYECTPADVPAVLGTLAFLNDFKKD
jgi:hypothetical protein